MEDYFCWKEHFRMDVICMWFHIKEGEICFRREILEDKICCYLCACPRLFKTQIKGKALMKTYVLVGKKCRNNKVMLVSMSDRCWSAWPTVTWAHFSPKYWIPNSCELCTWLGTLHIKKRGSLAGSTLCLFFPFRRIKESILSGKYPNTTAIIPWKLQMPIFSLTVCLWYGDSTKMSVMISC